jgi:hypothetical protein
MLRTNVICDASSSEIVGTALRASRAVGSFGVITHPIDDDVRAFYGKWGFQDLPFDPGRAMIVHMVDFEASGIER